MQRLRENNAICRSDAGKNGVGKNDFTGCDENGPNGNTCCPYSGSNGEATAHLTDILGERWVTVQATVEINGQTLTREITFPFGAGPLSNYKVVTSGTGVNGIYPTKTWNLGPDNHQIGVANWRDAAAACSGLPASNFENNLMARQSKLPSKEELAYLARFNNTIYTAGWPVAFMFTNAPYPSPTQYGVRGVTAVYTNASASEREFHVTNSRLPFVCLRY